MEKLKQSVIGKHDFEYEGFQTCSTFTVSAVSVVQKKFKHEKFSN